MARYEEWGYTYSKDKEGRYLEVYEQPRIRHLIWRAYHWWDMHSFKLMRKLEPLDWKLHNRKCNDDCMTGEMSRRGKDGEWIKSIETYCDHMPVTCRQDMRCFDLSMKGRVRISYDKYYKEDNASS